MDLVTILNDLRRRCLLVLAAALLAIGVGLTSAYDVSLAPPSLESRQFQVGLASASVLVDTPESQVVDVDPEGTDTLGLRANLLASLMAEGRIKEEIARRAGIPRGRLFAVAETATSPPTQLPSGDLEGAALLTVRPDEILPIIKITAHASDARRAAALANAAMGGLQSYLASKAVAEKVSNARRLVITRLGPAASGEVVRGPRRLVALGLAGFLFLAACAAIVVAATLGRYWREARVAGDPDEADVLSLSADPLPWADVTHAEANGYGDARQKIGAPPPV